MKKLVLLAAIILSSAAHAEFALERRPDVLKVLIEQAAQLRYGSKPLSQVLAEYMSHPIDDRYRRTEFANTCSKVPVNGVTNCTLVLTSAQTGKMPGPDGMTVGRYIYETNNIGYRVRFEANGAITIIDRDLTGMIW